MNSSQANEPAPRRNQRRSRRQPAKSSTKAKAYRNALGLGPNVAVGVLDVSETGARVLLKERLEEKTEFEIEFESANSRPVKLLAVVVWVVEAADGQFVAGVRFDKTLGYADLQAISKP